MNHILVRYGELTLKGNNKFEFINKLISNIKFKLKKYKDNLTYIKDNNSLVIKIENVETTLIINELKKIFGIYSISVIKYLDKNIDTLKEEIEKITSNTNKNTFKLEISRKDKTFPITSRELILDLSKLILSKTNLKVDVINPELKIEVLIKKDSIIIFDERIECLKGLPIGVSGKALSLLSGGIDSPVSSFLTMKRGMNVDFLHFMTPPYTKDEAIEKIFDLTKILANYNSNSTLYICDFAMLLQEIQHIPNESYRITIMRRMFIRIANLLCEKYNLQCIITGESLGQVASQTIESISVINEVSAVPILRPVLTYDKEEIIKISKSINTYETSILPFEDCCSLFVPKKPVIKPKSLISVKQEESIIWDSIIDHILENELKIYKLIDGKLEEVK